MEKINTLVTDAISNIENINNRRNHLTGIPSGLVELDRITSGWQKEELIIIAARPAMGKTAFALSIARNAAIDFGKSVAIFGVGATSIELTTRLIAIESEISTCKLKRLSRVNFEWEQINSKIKKLKEAKLFIDDTPGICISEIIAESHKLKEQQKIDLIIIENLQDIWDDSALLPGKQDISMIIRSLKSLASYLEVPLIVFSQLYRTVDRRKNYHPTIIDLPQRNMINSYASTIMFLHRSEYYVCDRDEYFDEHGVSSKEMAEIIIAKLNDEYCVNNIVKLKYESLLSCFSNYPCAAVQTSQAT